MKRAVVTGPTGAIGSALIKTLLENGVEVLAIVRRDSKRALAIERLVLEEGPHLEIRYCSLDELKDFKTADNYDVFYHFAWEGTAGPGRNDMYMQTRNIEHSLDAVRLAGRLGCKVFIGAGSQAEYGRSNEKLTADTPVRPEMGYGYAKLCAGLMTRDLAHQLGMQHIWTRILSVYGPNDGAQSMVMSTIAKLKNNQVPEFTKGEQIWDYLFSLDAAKAFYLLGNLGIDGKTYVIGSGQGRPLADYIRDIRDVVNPGCEINLGAVPYSEKQVMYLCADISELRQDTGFQPSYSFSEGIREILKDGE